MARTPTARTSKIVNMGISGGFYKVKEDLILDGIAVKKGEKLFVTNMEEIATKPKSGHITTACKALERQIAKDEAAITRLNAKKNEIDVSIEILRESIAGLQSEVESLKKRQK